MLVNSFELVNTWEVANATITSVPASVARGQANVAIGITNASALQGGATVTLGGQPCTITTYPGTSGNLIVTIPAGINLLYAAATHTFVYTDDNTSTSESAAVAFTPAAGRSYINLVDPAYADNGYILFGYEGTPAPVTGDQLEYPDVTAPTGIGFSVSATSEWVMDSDPVVNQTVDCQIIRAATGVRSATWTATYDAISESIVLSVPLGIVGITGLVPEVTVLSNQVINIPLGTIGITGLVPGITAEDNSVNIALSVPMGTIGITGLAPGLIIVDNTGWPVQNTKAVSQFETTVYLGRDNTITLTLAHGGVAFKPDTITKVALWVPGTAFANGLPRLFDAAPEVTLIDNATKVRLALSNTGMQVGAYYCYLTVYDIAHPNGVAWDALTINSVVWPVSA